MNQHSKKPAHARAKTGRTRDEKRSERKKAGQNGIKEPSEGRERIAKRIARSGVASRRDAEAMILQGRVKVNGNVLTSPAFNVSDGDVVHVDGDRLPDRERTRLFLFHKPAGTMTTNRDPQGRKTVFDILPEGLPRLVTVGRLDFTAEGLLLLTNDGGLARVLELPSIGWLRRYRARVHGEVDEAALDRLKNGIAVDGVLYGAIDASLDRERRSNAWLTVALREGKNREIKKVLGLLGLEVTRLIRVSYGPFQLGDLKPGGVFELKGRTLRDQLGERLIREAGADFGSNIRNPFSGTRAVKSAEDKGTERKPGAGRLKSSRQENLDRLQTSLPREERKNPAAPLSPRSRASNVWMAPGAKPRGDKVRKTGAGAETGKARARRNSRSGGPDRKRTKNADRRR